MPSTTERKGSRKSIGFATALSIGPFFQLAQEMQTLRQYAPLKKRKDGKYVGGILGFVKGLRLSARLIYILRERLSNTDLEVSWGHLVDMSQNSCSPECDIIIHRKGHVLEWNGVAHPVMHFKFVDSAYAVAVVSCKSVLTSIDDEYAKDLKKYGVRKVLLFAECCSRTRLDRLRGAARQAGYEGLWCLYLTSGQLVTIDDQMYVEFSEAVDRVAQPEG